MKCAFPEALQRRQASRRDPDAATVVRVHTRHTFTLRDAARTKVVPLDLLPRILCRAHAVACVRRVGDEDNTELLWRDGCVYEMSSGSVGKLSLENNSVLIDVRGVYPYYLWRCLSACVDEVVTEYDSRSMSTQLHLLCPGCDSVVMPLDGGAYGPGHWSCRRCACKVDLAPLVTPQLGIASSADDACDSRLQQLLGYSRHTDADAKWEEDDGRHELLLEQVLDLRRSVLASAAATVTRCGSSVHPSHTHPSKRPRRPNGHGEHRHGNHASVIDNTEQPRCWLALFNHDTDDGAGVTLHPVCEHPQHVHACVEAALRAAGVGVKPENAVALPVLTGAGLERCAPYLWRVTCLVQTFIRHNPECFPSGLARRVASTRRRLAALAAAHVTRRGALEPDWSWPGCEVDLACGSAVLRWRMLRCGHEPGGCVWECHRSSSGHPPARPTRYARRLAVVVGVSNYDSANLPLARGDAHAVGALLSRGADFESLIQVQWPFGCLGFNRDHDKVEVPEAPAIPAPWRDSNVCIVVDSDDGHHGNGGVNVSSRVNDAVEGMVKAARAAQVAANAKAAAAATELVDARRALDAAGAGDAFAAAEARVRACEEAAEEAREVAEAGCLLLLYFSGHGAMQITPSGNDVVMFTGGSSSRRRVEMAYPLSAALDAVCEDATTNPGDHCVVAFMDCCQLPDMNAEHSQVDPEAARFASYVLCACPPGDTTPASWAGAFSPLTAMLLAELPVRGETLANTGMRVAQRVQAMAGARRVPPHQWSFGGRAADVL